MAISLNISLDSVCPGGGHTTLAVVVDNRTPRKIPMETDEIRAPMTADEREQFIRLCVRMKTAGMTRTQTRNTLQTGFTVTL